MTGIEKIKERILADAGTEIAKIKDEAASRCAEITSAGETAAQDEYQKLFRKGTDDAEKRKERLESVAQLEARKETLAAKQNIITEAFELAVGKLLGMPDGEKKDFLAGLAVRAAHSGTEEVIFPNGTDRAFGEEVVAKANALLAAAGKNGALKLSAEQRDMRGGLILREGNIEANCSLDALVDDVRNDVTGEVAAILFE
ncbi:MAG: V-type ATP synthase subunit E [Oscillospiraceae bacterium]|nr:V-type ATP synthase subunit E [Oscillospiraceae bacterium]